MSFIARRIALPEGCAALPDKLVYRSDELGQLRDVATIVERARHAAHAIIERARDASVQLDERSAAVRRARERDADISLVARARALEESYRLAQAALTAQLESTLDLAFAAALANIGAMLSDEERLRIVCEQLRKAAGAAPAARLRLCAADGAIFRTVRMSMPWHVEIDDTLAPGQCRLATERHEWALDFDAVVASLSAGPESGENPQIVGKCL